MATLAEIRELIEAKRAQTVQIPPMTMDQYKVWNTLKHPHVAEENLNILMHNKKEYSNNLICPACDSHNMHHIGVELFNRDEDAEQGEHIDLYINESGGWGCLNVIPPENNVDSSMKNNPSTRRSGINIKLVCEQCHTLLNLGIAQDRGETKMKWRFYT